MHQIICPLCRLPLHREHKAWACGRGHSFDIAREGYVNLLPVQQKNSRDPGDNPQMVMARREFLQAGHYLFLRTAMLDLLAPLRAQQLLDIGCGEGYYTSAMTVIAPEVVGLDIAKPAIQLAAKRFQGITWLVASAATLPLADASVDLVTSLFSQLQVKEMQRVLKPGGHVLVVTPAKDHLKVIREHLFEDVRAHEPDKFTAAFQDGFDSRTQQEVHFPLDLDQQGLRQLLEMTPYAWRAKPEKRTALEQKLKLSTQAAFTLMLFQKQPA